MRCDENWRGEKRSSKRTDNLCNIRTKDYNAEDNTKHTMII